MRLQCVASLVWLSKCKLVALLHANGNLARVCKVSRTYGTDSTVTLDSQAFS